MIPAYLINTQKKNTIGIVDAEIAFTIAMKNKLFDDIGLWTGQDLSYIKRNKNNND